MEIDTLMGKYTQQEHLIQQLQANNQDLQRQLEVGLDTGLIKYDNVGVVQKNVDYVESDPTSQNTSGTDMMAVISDGGNSELSGSLLIQGK